VKSLARKQVITGLALTLTLLCLVNHYLYLGLFGAHGRQVLTFSFALLGIAALICAPNLEEAQEIKRRWRSFWGVAK
jgi:hypothetical protein